jgi:hypothetical protein
MALLPTTGGDMKKCYNISGYSCLGYSKDRGFYCSYNSWGHCACKRVTKGGRFTVRKNFDKFKLMFVKKEFMQLVADAKATYVPVETPVIPVPSIPAVEETKALMVI